MVQQAQLTVLSKLLLYFILSNVAILIISLGMSTLADRNRFNVENLKTLKGIKDLFFDYHFWLVLSMTVFQLYFYSQGFQTASLISSKELTASISRAGLVFASTLMLPFNYIAYSYIRSEDLSIKAWLYLAGIVISQFLTVVLIILFLLELQPSPNGPG